MSDIKLFEDFSGEDIIGFRRLYKTQDKYLSKEEQETKKRAIAAESKFLAHIATRTGNKAFIQANSKFLKIHGRALGDDFAAIYTTPVLDKFLTTFSNNLGVTDRLMPRVSSETTRFDYLEYPLRNHSKKYDTKLPASGRPNMVDFDRIKKSVTLEDRGLGVKVRVKDVQLDDSPLSMVTEGLEVVMSSMVIDREERKLGILTNSTNYGGNSVAFSGATQWDQSTSKPITDILRAMNDMRFTAKARGVGTTIWAFCSLKVWEVLRVHPQVLEFTKGLSGSPVNGKQQLINTFQNVTADNGVPFGGILTPDMYIDNANSGQAEDIKRLMNPATNSAYNCFGMVAVTPGMPNAGWGFSPEYFAGTRSQLDAMSGLKGEIEQHVVLSDGDYVATPKSGYLYRTVLNSP